MLIYYDALHELVRYLLLSETDLETVSVLHRECHKSRKPQCLHSFVEWRWSTWRTTKYRAWFYESFPGHVELSRTQNIDSYSVTACVATSRIRRVNLSTHRAPAYEVLNFLKRTFECFHHPHSKTVYTTTQFQHNSKSGRKITMGLKLRYQKGVRIVSICTSTRYSLSIFEMYLLEYSFEASKRVHGRYCEVVPNGVITDNGDYFAAQKTEVFWIASMCWNLHDSLNQTT